MNTRTLTKSAIGLLAATLVAAAHGDDIGQMMQMAKVDLVGAIEIASKETGGLVFYVELKEKSDLPVYEVKVLGGERHELLIDGQSGAVQKSKTKTMRDSHHGLLQKINGLGLTLTDGLPYLASKKAGSRPYRMEFDLEYDELVYKVRLLGGEKFDYQGKTVQSGKPRARGGQKPAAPPADPPAKRVETPKKTEPEPPAKRAETPKKIAPDPPAKIDPPAKSEPDRPMKTKPEREEAPAEAPAVVWNFDDTANSSDGWAAAETRPTKSLATWEVVKDDTAPSQPHAMALTETENYNGTFNIAVQENASYDNLDLSVKVKAVSGEEDQGGGPLWRAIDENNYYVCRFNPLESNYRVYKVVDGKRKQLATAKVETEVGKWYTIRVTMIDFEIICYLDGKKLLEAEDAALTEAGVIGLWTKADAVTSFDDLTVAPAED